MSLRVAVTGVLVLVAAGGTARAQGTPVAVEVTADALNVRDGPGGAVLGQVGRGQRFVAGAPSAGWLPIDWAGRRAWISATYARRVTGVRAVRVDVSALNVRAGASLGAARLGLVGDGQAYVRTGSAPGWVQVQFDRRAGWVSAQYVRDLLLGNGGGGGTTPPAPAPTGWAAVHAGLTQDGVPVPRRGVANGTLRGALGVAVEPYGEATTYGGAAFVRGTVSWFGGARDTGVTPTETGAITGERLRALNTPLRPTPVDLATRPGDFYYVAMRFDYGPQGRTWWRDARLLVVNPQNGRAVVVRPVDWGPHTRTARILDLSPQALADLGLTTDDAALVAFAAPGTALGPVR